MRLRLASASSAPWHNDGHKSVWQAVQRATLTFINLRASASGCRATDVLEIGAELPEGVFGQQTAIWRHPHMWHFCQMSVWHVLCSTLHIMLLISCLCECRAEKMNVWNKYERSDNFVSQSAEYKLELSKQFYKHHHRQPQPQPQTQRTRTRTRKRKQVIKLQMPTKNNRTPNPTAFATLYSSRIVERKLCINQREKLQREIP